MASVKITPNISVASKKYRPRKILPPQQSMKCTFLLPFPQCFSLPLDVVRHLFKNSKTSNVLLKLYQTCKYFYSKNQILIVSGKVTKQMPIVRYKFANNNNMKNIKKPYFWFDNDLFIKEEYFFNFQKIYRSTIKTLIIHGPTDKRGERRKANCIIQEVTPSTEEENEMGMLEELAEGTFIDSYKVINKLGIGSQGSVYSVEKDERIYALKIGHSPRAAKELEMETEVLKMATKKQLDHFCKYVDDGTYKKFYKYLVMSQVGKSLAQLLDGKEKFSNGCALIIAKQCFKALSNLHSMGYIHRDLMPSNFAIGLKEKENDGKDGRKNAMDEINNFHKIYLIDLGCCQNPHLTSEKEMNMLGNHNFCSMASHNNFELTYKDDMESLLYVILKFLGLFDGTSGVRNDILPIKQGIMENFKYSGDQVLPGTLPGIVGHIRSLKLGKNADVEYLMKSMDLVFEEEDIKPVLDWDPGFRYYGPRYALVPHKATPYFQNYTRSNEQSVSIYLTDGFFKLGKRSINQESKHGYYFTCGKKLTPSKRCNARILVSNYDPQNGNNNFEIANIIEVKSPHTCGRQPTFVTDCRNVD